MTTLHIVSSSPQSSGALDLAFSFASKGDAIILIENAVYGAVGFQSNIRRLQSGPADISCFVLQEDLSARALFTPLKDFNVVSYLEFVALVCQHNNSISWG